MNAQTNSHVFTVGIVGCGIIGGHHAKVLTRHQNFSVRALIDVSSEAIVKVTEIVAAETAAHGKTDCNPDGAEPAPQGYESLSAAIAAGGLDMIVITTPSGMHVDQAREAIDAGLHVVIEKPLDVSLSRARAIDELATQAAAKGQRISVISQHRFDPAMLKAKEAIEDGRLGQITSAIASVAWWRSQKYYDSGDWRGTWALDGGGAVMNQGVHTLDLLRWSLGTPTTVYAATALLAHERMEVEDTAAAVVTFDSGALGLIHCTTAAFPGPSARLSIFGDRGSVVLDSDRLEYFHTSVVAESQEVDVLAAPSTKNQRDDLIDASEHTGAPATPDSFALGHLRQFDDIASSLIAGRDSAVPVREAFLSLALVHALYASATLGQPVQFDEVLTGKYDDLQFEVKGTRA